MAEVATGLPAKALSTAITTLEIVELRELILIHLSVKDLFVNANRVCHAWYTTITINPSAAILEKLLIPTAAPRPVKPNFFTSGWMHIDVPAYSTVSRPNPLLPIARWLPESGGSHINWGLLVRAQILFRYHDLPKVVANLSPVQASMLLGQPSYTTMTCKITMCTGQGSDHKVVESWTYMLYNPRGLTYGDVVRTFAKCRDGVGKVEEGERTDRYYGFLWSKNDEEGPSPASTVVNA